MNVRPKTRETQVPRNRGTRLESGGPAQGPQRGQGRRSQPRREEGRSAQPPPFSLSPSLAPLNSLLSPGFSSRSRGPLLPARLNSSSARGARAASGGGAKCRRFLAPGEPSPLPGSGKDARRGGKPACGRQARAGERAVGPRGRRPGGGLRACVRPGAQPLRGQGAAPTHRGRGSARTREPVDEVAAVALGSCPFPGPGTA